MHGGRSSGHPGAPAGGRRWGRNRILRRREPHHPEWFSETVRDESPSSTCVEGSHAGPHPGGVGTVRARRGVWGWRGGSGQAGGRRHDNSVTSRRPLRDEVSTTYARLRAPHPWSSSGLSRRQETPAATLPSDAREVLGTGACAPSSNSRATAERLGSGSSTVAITVTTAPAMMYSAIGSVLSNVCSIQTASSGAGPPATTEASW